MAAISIFVSYAHADGDALKALRKHFAPLEREKLASLWSDQRLEVGDEWEAGIEAALATCRYVIPVLSASFFASSYIADKEIPRLLERQARGEIEILPIFWSACAEPSFPQRLVSGELKQRKLSDWQGIGTPHETLRRMGWSDRERKLADFVEALRRKLGKAIAPPPEARAVAHVEASGRVPLTVELRRESESLHIFFRRPGEKPFADRPLAWSAWAGRVASWNEVLDNYAPDKLQAWLDKSKAGAGQELRELIFGDEAGSEPILSQLFRHPPANFTWRPVDLRIVTNEPQLARLPWRLLAWHERWLTDDGWTMSLGRELDPGATVQIDSRREVLIAAAGDDAGLAEVLAAFLRERWKIPADDRLLVARSAKEVRWAFRGTNPQIVIATGNAHGAELVFADGKVELEEFALLKGADLWVLACPGAPSAAWSGFGRVVLCPRREGRQELFGEHFLLFFQNLLVDSLDPVAALHQLQKSGDKRAPDLATWQLTADYRHWVVQQEKEKASPTSRLLLDRINQKQFVAGLCWDLAKPESVNRILVVLAHAGPDASVRHHSEQLFSNLQQKFGRQIPVDKRDLYLTPRLGNLSKQLEVALQDLGIPGCTIQQVLRSLRPVAEGRERPILFLDCGTHESGADGFSTLEILEFFEFAHGALLASCPPELQLRILLYLGLELAEDALPAFTEELEKIRMDVSPRRGCRPLILPALHTVPFDELREYLEAYTQCSDVSRAARLIHRKAGGKFDATVELIDRGERGWLSLLHQLENEEKANAGKK